MLSLSNHNMKPPFYGNVNYLSKIFSIPNLPYFCHHLPVFPVYSNQVKILREPQDFYNELSNKASNANERLIIASLYIGTGILENKLVEVIKERLASKPQLKFYCLLDYTRASRGDFNSRKLLLPLMKQSPSSCQVSLFHTPLLRGLLKFIIPQRWNEIIGLQHMKVYIFDNSVIISGANLSNDYFVNRQDRYLVVNDCKSLADFYESLIKTVSSYSLQLQSDNTTDMQEEIEVHPYKGNYDLFCQKMKDSFQSLWNAELEKSKSRLEKITEFSSRTASEETLPNTLLFPSIQMPHFGVNIDSDMTSSFFQNAPENSKLHLASGYFNLTDQYVYSILNESRAQYNILCAHPKANGFLGAKGFAGGIPFAYTQLCKKFYQKVIQNRMSIRITVSEFQRDGWTFHGKGLWYFPVGETLPSCTMIGSPNFGYRSVHRDLETQLLIVSSCPSLRQNMWDEQERLYSSSTSVSKNTFEALDRVVPLWVKLVAYYLKFFF